MRRIPWLLALLVLGLGATDSQAQILLPGGYGYSYGRIGYGGLGILRPRVRMAFALGGVYGGGFGYVGGFGLAPYGYGRQVTVIYTPPIVLMPPPPRLFLDELDREFRPQPHEDLPRPQRVQPPPQKVQPPPAAPDQRLPKGDPVGGFRPLNQDNRAQAREPMPVPPEQPKAPEQAKPPERPAPPPVKTPPRQPRQPPELPRPPMPEQDPRDESARLIKGGRTSFAAGEYGRAAQRFRQATTVAPGEPLAHFLLAQALFALGKYADAVDAIHAGLALQPTWPTMRFRPTELYGPHATDSADHLRRLDAALHQRPDDAKLLFLYAYQLWFDGRREEARPFFQRAQPKAVHRGDIERFLRALLEAPVL